MNEWFETAFGSEYLSLYAHRDEKEGQLTVDLIMKATGISAGASVVDVPCGAGRHAREFSARGLSTYAADLSTALLKQASKDSAHDPIEYVRADMRSLPYRSGAFDLLSNLFSSFGYFMSDVENGEVMREFARVVRPGGYVVLDFLNEHRLRKELVGHSERTTSEGAFVREERRITPVPRRVEKTVHVRKPNGELLKFDESVRLFTFAELSDMMQRSGLKVAQIFGDYHGASFARETSPRCILFGVRL